MAAASSNPIVPTALVILLVTGPAFAATAPGEYHVEREAPCAVLPCVAWTGLHDSPDGRAAAHHIALSPDGTTAYVVGGTFTWETSTDLTTWAVSVRTGEILWSAAYDGPTSSDEEELFFHDVRFITVSPDGSRVAVAGTSRGPFGHGHDVVTVIYDAATGQEIWNDRYNGPASDEDTAAGIAVDRTGRFVVTAGSLDDRDARRSAVLLGYDLATGQRLWETPFSSPCGEADILGLQATPASASVLVGGIGSRCLSDIAQAPLEADLAFVPTVLAIDPATGQTVWEARDHDLLLTMQSAVFLGSLELADDRAYLSTRVTNPRNPTADLDVLTMAVDLSGAVLWHARYDSTGRDDLLGAKASADGRLYVVVESPAVGAAGVADQNSDIVVLAYDPDGTRAWTARLDSSTTGLAIDGRMVGGEGDDRAPVSAPALFSDGTRLALGYRAPVLSPVPLVGDIGRGVHVVAVLDTGDGSLAALRTEDNAWDEFSYAADIGAESFVGVGRHGGGFAFSAAIRLLSMDTTPPVLHLPDGVAAHATASGGATVHFDATATDAEDGVLPVACAPASGSTFSLGTTRVTCEATDTAGNAATGAFDVWVTFSWAGFQMPVQGDGTSSFHRGSAVPVKVELTDASAGVEDAQIRLWVRPEGGVEAAAQPRDGDGNVLVYDESTGDYRIHWDTATVDPGMHRLRVDFADGTWNTVDVRIT